MRYFILALLIGYTTSTVFAQSKSTERLKHFNLENNVAIQGYDPVSYFTIGKALKGNAKTAAALNGITYYFSSDANRKKFKLSPHKYEPQYGGYCAFAMGDYGKKVNVNPETFKILDGKLYLFYATSFGSALIKWNNNESILKSKGDENWNTITKK